MGRISAEDRKLPGPGVYDQSKTDLSPEGKYFYSKMQSKLASKFGVSQRPNIVGKA